MSALKYSRQRESIKEFLANRYDHPTADMIYANMRALYPNISLGTVYRNLNLLSDIGEAIKITTPDGGDRFDGNVAPHNHFYCKGCRRVLDLKMNMAPLKELNPSAQQTFDGLIESSSVLFFGKCQNWLKHPSENQ